jgi:RNA polymerase sigma factor (sigma-70 family)
MATVAPEPTVQALDQAFERLYQRYVADVYRYALALLRNPADAEDVTQTTFMNAYRAFKRGDEIHKPHNWLIKIAHNVARSRYAQAARRVQEVPLEDHIEQLAVPEDDRPDLDTVLRALGRLPFNQRAALVMRELEGRTYAEIADTLGVSVSAVETLIFRARKSLRVKASSLRVLAGVPLPGSLAPLVEGGGAIAGSSAIAGAGFVAKALVAVAVGVVATSIGGDRSGPAGAAEGSAGLAPASVSGAGADTGPVAARAKKRGPSAKRLLVRGRVASHRATGRRAAGAAPTNGVASRGREGEPTASVGVVSSAASPAASPSQAGSRGAPMPSSGTPPQAPVQVATTVAQNVVDTVAGAVPPIATPSLPVNPPSLPPVTVPVPPGTAPSVPSVQAPPLPPAPPLPRLP